MLVYGEMGSITVRIDNQAVEQKDSRGASGGKAQHAERHVQHLGRQLEACNLTDRHQHGYPRQLTTNNSPAKIAATNSHGALIGLRWIQVAANRNSMPVHRLLTPLHGTLT